MFGFSRVGNALQMLLWPTFWLFQAFHTWKDSLIIFYMWPSGRYLIIFHMRLYVVCISSFRNRTLLYPFFPNIQSMIQVVLLTIKFYLMRASAWLKYWKTLESHFYISLEVSYLFCKVLTTLWLLVDARDFLRYWYNIRVQPCLYDGK